MDRSFIPGCFGKKRIYYDYKAAAKPSDDFYLFFHGSFSSSYNSEKTTELAKHVASAGLGNSFTYETSRDLYTFETDLPYEEYKKAFGLKTYAEELEDVKSVFSFFMESFVRQKAPRLHFAGFSLGGTHASYLLPQYGPLVTQIFLFGSGVTTKVKGSTYDGYPDKSEILRNYRDYSGEIYIVQGSEDTIVPQKSALEIFNYAPRAKRKDRIILDGVNHTFRKLYGQPAIPRINDMIFSLLRDHAF